MSGETFSFHAIRTVDARIEPFDWAFARDEAATIEAIWQREVAERPLLFNGTVLLQHRGEVRGEVFHAGYAPVEYRAFLAWMRLGNPPPAVRNGFAMAALQACDGAFLLGEMAAHTANAGKVYFAAGTPDLSDVVDGTVDLDGSVRRELSEETGLRAGEVMFAEGWHLVLGERRAAFLRPARLDWPAEAARAILLERLRAEPEPELADLVIVRTCADLDRLGERVPPFQRAYLERVLAPQPPG